MAEKPSGQRTEKPTPKRLREARRKGQIPRSPDLVGWFALLVATYVLPMMIGLLEERFNEWFHTTTQALAARQWRRLQLLRQPLVRARVVCRPLSQPLLEPCRTTLPRRRRLGFERLGR